MIAMEEWIPTSEKMPAVGRRVLCAMYADTEYGFPVCGLFDGEYWIVDDVQQLVDKKRVQYWCPIARIPRRHCLAGNYFVVHHLLAGNYHCAGKVVTAWTL